MTDNVLNGRFQTFRSNGKPKTHWSVRVLRTLGAAGLIVVALYFYQPHRYNFFPKALPVPNPRVDPDLKELFHANTRIAVVTAHPDDSEYYIAGMLLKLAKSKAQILLIVCTDGDKGYYTRLFTNPDENRRIRRGEQTEAAKLYGASIVFLAQPDGRLQANNYVVSKISEALNTFRPEYLLAFDADYPPQVQHSDHLQSGVAAALAAPRVSSLRWILRYSTSAPNYILDVTPFWEGQQRALALHKSQFSGNQLDAVIETAGAEAQEAGNLIHVDYAEPFRCTRI